MGGTLPINSSPEILRVEFKKEKSRLQIQYNNEHKLTVSFAACAFKEPTHWIDKLSHFIKGFTWKVIVIKEGGSEQKVWVNVNSAVQRLKAFGMEKKDVKEYMKSGRLMEEVQKRLLIKPGQGKDTKNANAPNKLAPIQKLKSASALQNFYQEVMGCQESVAQQVITFMKSLGISEQEIEHTLEFIRNHPGIAEQAKNEQKTQYIRTKGDNNQLQAPVRALAFTSKGEIYFSLTKLKNQDKLVGKGAEKKVKETVNLKTGRVDVQYSKVVSLSGQESLRKEIEAYAALKHSNIIEVYPETLSFTSSGKVKTDHLKARWISKYYNGGDLADSLNTTISEQEKKVVTRSILRGLAYMHEKNRIHRDLKPANIYLEKNEGKIENAVVGDLDLARSLPNENGYIGGCVGTPLYMAPETIGFLDPDPDADPIKNSPKTTKASDCWSMGCTLYQMYKGPLPWSDVGGRNLDEVLQNLRSKLRDYHQDRCPGICDLKDSSDPIDQIIYQLLSKDPDKRLTAQGALTLLPEE